MSGKNEDQGKQAPGAQPIYRVKAGTIGLAVWIKAERGKTQGSVYSFRLERSYYTPKGFRVSPGFGEKDIPLLRELLDKMELYVADQVKAHEAAKAFSGTPEGSERDFVVKPGSGSER